MIYFEIENGKILLRLSYFRLDESFNRYAASNDKIVNYQERIISDHGIMLGKPIIKGTRITVERELPEYHNHYHS